MTPKQKEQLMTVSSFTPLRMGLTTAAILLLCGCAAALSAPGTSARAAASLQGDRAVIEQLFTVVLNGNRLASLNRIIAPDYADYSPVPGQAPGVVGVRAKIESLREAFPDIHYTLEAMVAEGDLVAVRWYFTGTQTGKFGNIAPTGRRVHMDGIDFYRIESGRITAHWACEDKLGLLTQLGVIKPD